MQKIKKFEIGRKYYPSEKRVLLQIVERNGKELKVVSLRQQDRETFTAIASLTADEKGAYEYFLYNGVLIPATNILPHGQLVSKLSHERQKVILDAVKRDVEYRKARNLDCADVLTEHIMNENGETETMCYEN